MVNAKFTSSMLASKAPVRVTWPEESIFACSWRWQFSQPSMPPIDFGVPEKLYTDPTSLSWRKIWTVNGTPPKANLHSVLAVRWFAEHDFIYLSYTTFTM